MWVLWAPLCFCFFLLMGMLHNEQLLPFHHQVASGCLSLLSSCFYHELAAFHRHVVQFYHQVVRFYHQVATRMNLMFATSARRILPRLRKSSYFVILLFAVAQPCIYHGKTCNCNNTYHSYRQHCSYLLSSSLVLTAVPPCCHVIAIT